MACCEAVQKTILGATLYQELLVMFVKRGSIGDHNENLDMKNHDIKKTNFLCEKVIRNRQHGEAPFHKFLSHDGIHSGHSADPLRVGKLHENTNLSFRLSVSVLVPTVFSGCEEVTYENFGRLRSELNVQECLNWTTSRVGNAALTAEVVATLQWVCLDEGNARGVVHSDLVEVLFTKAHPENTPISHPTLHTDTLRLLHSLLRFTCFSTRPNPTSTSPHSNKLPTASFASLLHNSVLAPSLPYLLFLAPSPSSLPDSPPNSYLFCLILRLMEFATAHHPTLLLFQHSHLSISFVHMILQTQHSGLLFWHITDFVDTLQRWSMELPVIAQQGRECVALLDQEGLLDALEALVFAAEGGQRRYGGETVRTASMNAFRERGGNG
ncbi:hypothetical protein BLNAU_22257 [Blattamonas nauphoetae]|uniref:Uncharacterized protein n=1 Tax=Blattamonas nauphoetae TaxID=2049346 RepID=A0ABQ9WU52_9EUKA|nr:hypothetical protein BLNAU_22257 [Blattamonas nauphoetae]